MLVHDFLQQSAASSPEKTALVFGTTRLTYSEIDAAANRLANYLLANGVSRGDRVCIYMENCVEAVIAIFGILKAGAVFSFVNGSTKADKLAYILNNCRAAALITHRRKSEVVARVVAEVPSLLFTVLAGGRAHPRSGVDAVSFEDALAAHPPTLPRQTCIDVDLATIIYTSGSTGFPKGVMSPHTMVVAAATSITQYLENTPDDVILNVLPLSFDYGLYQVLMGFKVGATIIVEDGFAFPYRVLELVHKEKVTGLPGVPTLFALLLQIKDVQGMAFPHLRYLTNTAAALPVSHIQRLRQTFPEAKLYSMYGLTECKRVSYLPPEELDRRPASVGVAIPNTEVYIVDDAGNRVLPGQVGELVVRGSHVMRGYWEAPEATAKALRPGPYSGEQVLCTGDLFRTDEDGFLYFVGRKDDIIKSRGEKVSPREVENVLHALDGVVEAAVVGVPDELLGEAILAALVVANGTTLSEREVIAHCARHLESFMVPKHVEFRSGLPKTSTGKISRMQLRELVQCAAS
jgi:amino acid adenylation domain-containing protein